jgi:general secretion pathway protein G
MRRDAGFTLIELLVVVAVIGLIVAIAIPNLLAAIDRGKQKRTMADIRSIAVAVESYAVDVNLYPRYPSVTVVQGGLDVDVMPYNPTIPLQDAWAADLLYESDAVGSAYTILSYGKDQLRSPASAGRTDSFDCDIIYQGGTFVAWPEGIQT